MTEYVIETRDLKKRFGIGPKAVHAVNGIDLKVTSGIHGFLGPNGAGKSTTIKMLVGGISITSGKASIKGYRAGSTKARSCIGYLPEQPKFYHYSFYKYLVYLGRLGGLSRGKAKGNAMELIEWFELDEAMERDVNDFSAGMRQKAGLAQALIHEPEVLILDEPTANLDPIGRANIIEQIRGLADEKEFTVLVSSHILSEIEKLADEVTIINRGRIILSDSIGSLKNLYAGDHFILDTDANDDFYEDLKSVGYISKMWFDNKERVHLITEDPARLKDDLPNMILSKDTRLHMFAREDVTLEDIFLRAVAESKTRKRSGVRAPPPDTPAPQVPSMCDPSSGDPSSGDPSSGDPSVGDPSVCDPSTGDLLDGGVR